MEEVLTTIWDKHSPDTILDLSFVNDVIYPAMKEWAESQTKELEKENAELRKCINNSEA